jgi:hypothetical protein
LVSVHFFRNPIGVSSFFQKSNWCQLIFSEK